jgi:hypothetical protein
MGKLMAAFSGAAPDVTSELNEAQRTLRYGLYEKTLTSLDKLASNPSLTEPQKKVVADVIEQMKQVVAKLGAARQ